MSRRHSLDDLLTLMAVLRDPEQGCPWDLKQGWDSIVPHTLEEAYEVADAIERRAWDELPGELGDLLFQVVYYAQFGDEEGRFDFHDVVDTLTAKMLRRHPHVFPQGTLASRRPPGVSAAEIESRQVNSRWETLKAEERAARAARERVPRNLARRRCPIAPRPSVLDDVPRNLPALSRAAKLSKRAARVGFDWPDSCGVIAKIREELDEVEEALAAVGPRARRRGGGRPAVRGDQPRPHPQGRPRAVPARHQCQVRAPFSSRGGCPGRRRWQPRMLPTSRPWSVTGRPPSETSASMSPHLPENPGHESRSARIPARQRPYPG